MRFIQVGVGGFGQVWVQQLIDSPSAEVVALVDVSQAALTAACNAGNYGEEICFTTLDKALKSVKADALVCVTPPEYHKQCIVQAMQAGLDVITEKPMADSLTNCISILKTSLNTGRTCVVSQNYRYRPELWTLARLIENGRIGSVGQVKVDFYMGVDFKGGFRHEMDYPLLIDMAIHHFDLIRFVTGLNAVSVRGETWNPAWSNYSGDCSSSLVFEMENGGRVVYNASWCAKGQFCDWNGNWQIEGSKGSISYADRTISVHDVPELYEVENTTVVTTEKLERTEQSYVLDDLIASVTRGARPHTDVFDNIHSVSMVFAAVKAVKTGKRIPILDKRVQQMIAEYDQIGHKERKGQDV
jgi:predicted dehydrogenase